MKKVDIISTIVGRDTTGKPIGGGMYPITGSYAIKSELEALRTLLNNFLEGEDTDTVINRWKELEYFLNGISEDNTLKKILGDYIPIKGYTDIIGEKNFTGGIKVNGSPIYYDSANGYWKLEGDLIVTGGVSMYSSDSEYTPSTIMDAIPVDGTTISKEGGVLKVIGDLDGGLDYTELESYLSTNQYAKKSDIPSLSGYATESWVEGKGYALSSDLSALSTKLNDFLEGSDTDNIINKWKELESFLTGLSESDNLATILGNKAEKTDLDKYIPIAGATDITGEKNFIGGMKVNGSPIYYDTEKKYWKLEGDLLVTGGVTMYANEGTYTPSTIMDAILYDDSTLGINANGELYVKGSVGGATTMGSLSNVGSWADSVASQDRIMYQAANSSTWVAKNLSDLAVGGVVGDYLPLTGGKIYGVGDYASSPLSVYGDNYDYTGIEIGVQTYQRVHIGYWTSLSGLRLENLRNSYGISIQNDNSLVYYTHSSGSNFVKYPILHSGNYSNYALPITGGTITSNDVGLVIKRTTNYPIISFYGGNTSTQSFYGALGFGGLNTPVYVDNTGGNIYTLLHANNYSSYALPLSGGVLTSSLNKILELNTTGTVEVGMSFSMSSVAKGWVGYIPSDGTILYNNASTATLGIRDNGTIHFNNNTIWHAGNDGAGSGLDADLLDGYHVNNSQKPFGTIPIIGKDGVMEIGHYLDFHFDNTTGSDFSTRIISTGNYGNNINLPTASGTLALTSSNVASATKLATARTIWGQSFDGTGNVDGHITSSTTLFIISSNSQQLFAYDYTNKYLSIGYSPAASSIPLHLYGNAINFYYGASRTQGMILNSSGNVGIGTTSPAYKLHINGVFYCENNLNTPFGYTIVSTGTYVRGRLIADQSTDALWLQAGNWSGNSLNGTLILSGVNANDLSLCKIQGPLLTTGGITMYSDIRKKTILNHVELSLKDIANAPLIEHYYNSDDKKTTHVGSIAQYWVGLNDWFCKEDNEGYYTMEIQNAALASAISIARELDRYESKTDRKIRQLKKRISQLEDELETLKNR